jgi:hypothetical protein
MDDTIFSSVKDLEISDFLNHNRYELLTIFRYSA